MKKGKFSLYCALVLLVAGCLFLTVGILDRLSVLPQDLKALMAPVAFFTTLGGTDLTETGVFLLLDSLLVFIFRRRKPFSMFLVVYLWPAYLTLAAAVRRFNGTELQAFFPDAVRYTKPGYLFLLFTLELLLACVLLAAVSGLDERWRKKQDLKQRLLEKEGIVDSKEMKEEEKLLRREKKRKAHEERLQAKENARYERERAKAAEKEDAKEKRRSEKERKDYEKTREREELRREAKEEKQRRKALKEQDKLLEKEELDSRREQEKAGKEEKLRLQEELKRRKAEEEEQRLREEADLGPEPEYPRGLSNPDTPLEFPAFDPMPNLSVLFHKDEEPAEDYDPLEDLRGNRPQVDNSSFIESLQREMEREEEESDELTPPEPMMNTKRFQGGGMLESVLETFNSEPTVQNVPQRPIIGLGEGRVDTPEAPASSIAPSNLSPDHPRYRMFEALQRGERPQTSTVQEQKNDGVSAPSYLSPDHPRYKMFESLRNAPVAPNPVEEKEEGVAPSTLSPDHPRYKMFESLKGSPEPRVTEKVEKEEGIAPSNLSPDHPRYRLFQSLKKTDPEAPQESGVSHFPGRTFEPEDIREIKHTYDDVTKIEEPPVEEPEAKTREEEEKSQLLERLGAGMGKTVESKAPVAEPEPEPEPEPAPVPAEPIPEEEDEDDDIDVEVIGEEEEIEVEEEEEEVEPAPAYVPPSNPEIRSVKTAEDGHRIIQTKSEEDQEDDFNLSVGVGDLAANRAGYTAIKLRQEALYTPPDPSLLKDYPGLSSEIDPETYQNGQIIVQTLADQHITVEVSAISKGPTVTMYELKLAQGVIISKIRAREDELNYALGGKRIRIQAPIPGKQAVGIEVPNTKTSIVGFKDMVYSLRANEKYCSMKVPMILGKTITGEPIVIDVAKMPHMIIAGTTGSGKSVCINTFINTIIFQKGPKDVRLVMVDPKQVELNMYNGIPHLLTPVIFDPKRAIKALDWLVAEMERRYAMLSKYNVRNLEGLNEKIAKGVVKNVEKLPYIVCIMDEFADIVNVVGKDMDIDIQRLAAKARAAGIHLILATQRPSADVVTGTLKSNLPGRIAFAVSSGINSKVILDEMGAENLLGKGDMLLLNPSEMGLKRIQGAYMSDGEVEAVSEFARDNNPMAQYLEESIFEEEEEMGDIDSADEFADDGSEGGLYEMAKQIVFERKGASASYLQRRLKIGYNRAARLVEMMEEEGIVGPANGSKPREILRFD